MERCIYEERKERSKIYKHKRYNQQRERDLYMKKEHRDAVRGRWNNKRIIVYIENMEVQLEPPSK